MQKILLIDDSIFTLHHYSEIIEKLGYEVIIAKNGKDGVEAFIQQNPDIVLCDLMMPDMDGLEVLEEIKIVKKDFSFFFLVTADIQENTKAKALKLGAKDLVCKPITAEKMLEVLNCHAK